MWVLEVAALPQLAGGVLTKPEQLGFAFLRIRDLHGMVVDPR